MGGRGRQAAKLTGLPLEIGTYSNLLRSDLNVPPYLGRLPIRSMISGMQEANTAWTVVAAAAFGLVGRWWNGFRQNQCYRLVSGRLVGWPLGLARGNGDSHWCLCECVGLLNCSQLVGRLFVFFCLMFVVFAREN